jgi:hypothetical protein
MICPANTRYQFLAVEFGHPRRPVECLLVWTNLWRIIGIADDDPLNLITDSQIVLLRFASTIIHNEEQLKGLDPNFFIETFEKLVDMGERILERAPLYQNRTCEHFASALRLYFDIFKYYLGERGSLIPWENQAALASYVISTYLFSELIVELLKSLCKYIPRRVPSTAAIYAADPVLVKYAEWLKGRKSDCIEILTLVIHNHAQVKNTIREDGGLPLILSQAAIDDDNPCMSPLFELNVVIRERAWLLTSGLMENNQMNQEAVREMLASSR